MRAMLDKQQCLRSQLVHDVDVIRACMHVLATLAG